MRAGIQVVLRYAGRGGGTRTHDLLYPKQARYQAAPRPDGRTGRTLWATASRCKEQSPVKLECDPARGLTAAVDRPQTRYPVSQDERLPIYDALPKIRCFTVSPTRILS